MLVVVLFIVINLLSTCAHYGPHNGDIRLSGANRCSGHLQIFEDDVANGKRWYQVCGRHFGKKEAEVACRQLRCPTGNSFRIQGRFRCDSEYHIGRGYECIGDESSLSFCRQIRDYDNRIEIRCQRELQEDTHEESPLKTALILVTTVFVIVMIVTICLIGFIRAHIVRRRYQMTSSPHINSFRTQRNTSNTHTFYLHQQPPIPYNGTSTTPSFESDEDKTVKDSSLQVAPPPAYPATGYMLATDDAQSFNLSKETQSDINGSEYPSGSMESIPPPSYESVVEASTGL